MKIIRTDLQLQIGNTYNKISMLKKSYVVIMNLMKLISIDSQGMNDYYDPSLYYLILLIYSDFSREYSSSDSYHEINF